MPKKFVSTNSKRFQMTFANGLTASVQWGRGNYCDNHFNEERATWCLGAQCDNAEVAVFKGGNFIDIDQFLSEDCSSDGTVAGFLTPEQAIYFLRKVSEYDPNAVVKTPDECSNATERTAHIVINVHDVFDVKNCADCPYAKGIDTEDPYDGEKHYYCYATPDHKMIQSYLWDKSELKGIPEWCPCMVAKASDDSHDNT